MRVALVRSLAILAVSALAGCAGNPYQLQSQNQVLQQQQIASQQRSQELQARATTLDQDNQELQSLLAQARQQDKLLEDQLAAVREQLSSTSAQLAQTRQEKQLTEQQAEAVAAAARRRGGAIITANSSFRRSLPAINVPGIEVRPDGDVVRIELPASRLFQPGNAILQPAAGVLIANVAAEIVRVYPGQIVGVEGHTDSDPVRAAPGANEHLSVGRSMAVYQELISRTQLQPSQLFVAGHGSNHPVVSNATPAGKQRNNRVELVIYPDKAPGQ